MPPLVSIIITTRNEEHNIANCLESVLQQTYFCDKIEIIVVDNNSTDKTKDAVESYKVGKSIKSKVHNVEESSTKRFTPLNVKLFNRGPERSAQRNFGVAQSSGEYILYLDADMILSENVIKDCVKTIQNSKFKIQNSNLIGLYIPEIIMGESLWCRVRRFERSFYDGTVIDCVRFIRKDVFQKVGGFDESMSGPEDWDLDRKIRQIGKTALISSPIYHNEAEFNLKKYLNKKAYYAKSFSTYVAKWSQSDNLQSDGIKAQVDPEIKKQLGFLL